MFTQDKLILEICDINLTLHKKQHLAVPSRPLFWGSTLLRRFVIKSSGLNVLDVLNVINMLEDTSRAYWAKRIQARASGI